MSDREKFLELIEEYGGEVIQGTETLEGLLDDFRVTGVVWKDNNQFGMELVWLEEPNEKTKFLEQLQGRGYIDLVFQIDRDLFDESQALFDELLSRNWE